MLPQKAQDVRVKCVPERSSTLLRITWKDSHRFLYHYKFHDGTLLLAATHSKLVPPGFILTLIIIMMILNWKLTVYPVFHVNASEHCIAYLSSSPQHCLHTSPRMDERECFAQISFLPISNLCFSYYTTTWISLCQWSASLFCPRSCFSCSCYCKWPIVLPANDGDIFPIKLSLILVTPNSSNPLSFSTLPSFVLLKLIRRIC